MNFLENQIAQNIANQVAIEKSLGKDITPELYLDLIEKAGRGAPLGEVRTWNGKEYIKTPKGWRPKPKGYKEGAKEQQPKRANRYGATDVGEIKNTMYLNFENTEKAKAFEEKLKGFMKDRKFSIRKFEGVNGSALLIDFSNRNGAHELQRELQWKNKAFGITTSDQPGYSFRVDFDSPKSARVLKSYLNQRADTLGVWRVDKPNDSDSSLYVNFFYPKKAEAQRKELSEGLSSNKGNEDEKKPVESAKDLMNRKLKEGFSAVKDDMKEDVERMNQKKK